MKPKVYIDGKDGTTGLQIYDRLAARDDIDLLLIDEAKRKDPDERKRLMAEADIVFLCLPDAAAVEAVALAESAAGRNGLTGQLHFRLGDLRRIRELLPAGSFDLVVSNPPYFSLGSGGSGGPARSEEHCALEELCAAAARLVRNGGRFALCHRPERLTDVVCILRASGLEPKRLKLVSHGPGHPPSLLLVEGVRQGKPGLTIEG